MGGLSLSAEREALGRVESWLGLAGGKRSTGEKGLGLARGAHAHGCAAASRKDLLFCVHNAPLPTAPRLYGCQYGHRHHA